jgi:hypothetical protein
VLAARLVVIDPGIGELGEQIDLCTLKIIDALHSQIQAHRTAGIKGSKVSRHNTLEIGSDESP